MTNNPRVPRPSPPQPSAPLRERLQAKLFEAPDRPANTPAPAAKVAAAPPTTGQARVPISISELTDRMGRHLAINFSSVCVMGEISKVQTVASGHTYFTLKDAGAAIDAMVWADRLEGLSVHPKQGMRVVAVGSVRIFAPSGRYSLHVDVLEAVGAGDLQKAFEALKARLATEGLFADSRKRKLPTFLRTIGVVTSATGAVRHDIERTLTQGQARVRILLAPSRVQGEGAGVEIGAAIRMLAEREDVDLIVVARGGGSIEELWPFNEEAVVRAIAASRPPVISAVGHETDFTLCDFVADHRASTPTGAAKEIVDIQRNARLRTESAASGLRNAMEAKRERWRRRLDAVSTHRVIERERTRLERLRGRLGETFARARTTFDRKQVALRTSVKDLATRCEAQAPHEQFARAHARIDRAVLSMRSLVAARISRSRARATQAFDSRGLRGAGDRLAAVSRRFRERMQSLDRSTRSAMDRRRSRFRSATTKLEALSPLSVLNRGYALTTTPDGRILTDVGDVATGDSVLVRLFKGRFRATVTEREEEK